MFDRCSSYVLLIALLVDATMQAVICNFDFCGACSAVIIGESFYLCKECKDSVNFFAEERKVYSSELKNKSLGSLVCREKNLIARYKKLFLITGAIFAVAVVLLFVFARIPRWKKPEKTAPPQTAEKEKEVHQEPKRIRLFISGEKRQNRPTGVSSRPDGKKTSQKKVFEFE